MSEKFVVTIPVKPYVKRFIELNYGSPADFTKCPELQKEVHRCLRKPVTEYDRQFENKLTTYTQNLEIVISQDNFYRYGWEFSKSDIVSFGKIFEYRIKSQMHLTVTVYRGLGLSTKKSILKFQEYFSMEEEYWKYESIVKEYYRKKQDVEIDFFGEIIEKINHLFMSTLSVKKDNVGVKKHLYETVE